jgi:hypothetical protein
VRVTFGPVLATSSAKDLVAELAAFWGAHGPLAPGARPSVEAAPSSPEGSR